MNTTPATRDMPTTSAFAELRDQLKARLEHPHSNRDVNVSEAQLYLTSLSVEEQTQESVEALLQLARTLHYEERPREAFQIASQAAKFAHHLNERQLLWDAHTLAGISLTGAGEFSEAVGSLMEAWSLARDLGDTNRQARTIGNFGALCAGMGQWRVATRYFERSRELAERSGLTFLELQARNNFAHCTVQLREPLSGLSALSNVKLRKPKTFQDKVMSATLRNTSARLHLLVGNVDAAHSEVEKSDRLARLAHWERTRRSNMAVRGLVQVEAGAVAEGLHAVEHALSLAIRDDHTNAPDYLGMCIDAHEACGRFEGALTYLHQLVAWKRKSLTSDINPLQYDALTDPVSFLTGTSVVEDALMARARSFEVQVQECLQRLMVTAINAEIASGHDLYRTFRIANLARHVCYRLGCDEFRTGAVVLGAQLSNIGMIGVPTRLTQSPNSLSLDERRVINEHTIYGAELLRRPKLRILDVASVIAEQHHEHYDGSGYPFGLRGDAISQDARLVALCDVFDALTHSRPFRVHAMSVHIALSELEQKAGSQFDPLLTRAFVQVIRDFPQHEDLDGYLADGAEQSEYVRARARMDILLRETR